MIGRYATGLVLACLLAGEACAAPKEYVCKGSARTGLEQAKNGSWKVAKLLPEILTVKIVGELGGAQLKAKGDFVTHNMICKDRMDEVLDCRSIESGVFILDTKTLEFSFSRNLDPHRLSKGLEPLLPYTLDVGIGTCRVTWN